METMIHLARLVNDLDWLDTILARIIAEMCQVITLCMSALHYGSVPSLKIYR